MIDPPPLTARPAYAPQWARRWQSAAAAALIAGAFALAVYAFRMSRAADADVNPDGISYLDLSDAWLQGDPWRAVTGYWSLLYPALIALARAIGRPDATHEFATVARMNATITVAAVLALAWFALALGRRFAPGASLTAPRLALGALALACASWAYLQLITVYFVTPDMTVALLVAVAAALMVELRDARPGAWRAPLLGVVLALAYAAKSAMLPIGAVFVAGTALALRQARGSWRAALRPATAVVVPWLVLALLQVAVVSRAFGEPTIGTSSRLVRAWFVNGVRYDKIWRGTDTSQGPPPTVAVRVHDGPPAYVIDSTLEGTFPVWRNPDVWIRDLAPPLALAPQLRVFMHWAVALAMLLAPILAGSVVLVLLGGAPGATWRALMGEAYLLVPPLAALAAYATLLVEPRYIAPFLPLLALGLLVASASATSASRAALPAVATSVALFIAIEYVTPIFRSKLPLPVPAPWERSDAQADSPPVWPAADGAVIARYVPPWEAVARLNEAGVAERSAIAVAGDAIDSPWARTGRFRILADVPVDATSLIEAGVAPSLSAALHRSSIRWLVARSSNATRVGKGWQQLAGTDVFLHDTSTPAR